MRKLVAFLPPAFRSKPELHRADAAAAVAAWQALWHPALLADAEALPQWAAPERGLRAWDPAGPAEAGDTAPAEPTGPTDAADEPAFVVASIPASLADTLPPTARARLAEPGHCLILATGPADTAALVALLAPLHLPEVPADLLEGFFALAYARMGLAVLLERMAQPERVDAWTLEEHVRQAATAALAGDGDGCRNSLRAAFDALASARQSAFPATVCWVELDLHQPGADAAGSLRRLEAGVACNLFFTGAEAEALAAADPTLAAKIGGELGSGVELVGGVYDARPWMLLGTESRLWQIDRGRQACRRAFGREPEIFGARHCALSPDTPSSVMKHNFRYAVHLSFDGATMPGFRDAKIHWTGPDSSAIESLVRPPCNGMAEDEALTVFVALAEAMKEDRGPTLPVVRFLHRGAQWHEWLLAGYQHAAVFGRMETLSDYFVSVYTPHRPAETRFDDYAVGEPEASRAAGRPDPLGRWIEPLRRRGEFDAAAALLTLAYLVDKEPSPLDLDELEDAVELSHGDAGARVAALLDAAAARLETAVLAGGGTTPGVLAANPSGFARRVGLELPALAGLPPAGGAVKAVQPLPGGGVAAVVDLPGWGFAWFPQSGGPAGQGQPAGPAMVVGGRKLRNEFVEVEIDPKTGGLRGLWDTRTGYSRLGQQLAHTAGSRMVQSRRLTIAAGPAFAELLCEGEIVRDRDGKRLARYAQTVRLWKGRPFVELRIRLEPEPEALRGPDDEFRCRWAWPDEKTTIAAAAGGCVQTVRVADFIAPEAFELRERHLATVILPQGLAFHRRIAGRMADTRLLGVGDRLQEFRIAIGVDVAAPRQAAQEFLWPALARPVSAGPPSGATLGWLGRLAGGTLLPTSLRPNPVAGGMGIRLRVQEQAGATTRTELRFARPILGARLTNARGELVYELAPADGAVAADFGSNESAQVEAEF